MNKIQELIKKINKTKVNKINKLFERIKHLELDINNNYNEINFIKN